MRERVCVVSGLEIILDKIVWNKTRIAEADLIFLQVSLKYFVLHMNISRHKKDFSKAKKDSDTVVPFIMVWRYLKVLRRYVF